MGRWVTAAKLAELDDGDVLGVVLDGKPLALYRVQDRVYATDDICTHAYARLSDGYFDPDDCSIECPMHSGRFDVTSGAPIDGPVDEPVSIYSVRIEGGTILVQLD